MGFLTCVLVSAFMVALMSKPDVNGNLDVLDACGGLDIRAVLDVCSGLDVHADLDVLAGFADFAICIPQPCRVGEPTDYVCQGLQFTQLSPD